MIDSIIKDRCTGCEGCASVCPTKCIDMVQNYEGFFMPQVNSNKCVNCKMCINICPVINYDKNHRNTAPEEHILLNSSLFDLKAYAVFLSTIFL